MKDFYADTLLARFDELLDKEPDLTPDEADELDALLEWYEVWLDYALAIDNIRIWYEKH